MDEAVYGPLQLLVILFSNPNSHGQIQRELEPIMNKGMIRLIDHPLNGWRSVSEAQS